MRKGILITLILVTTTVIFVSNLALAVEDFEFCVRDIDTLSKPEYYVYPFQWGGGDNIPDLNSLAGEVELTNAFFFSRPAGASKIQSLANIKVEMSYLGRMYKGNLTDGWAFFDSYNDPYTHEFLKDWSYFYGKGFLTSTLDDGSYIIASLRGNGNNNLFQEICIQGIIDDNQPKISLLESWQQTINLTINTIMSWLYFSTYPDLCDATKACGCVDECNQGQSGCVDGDTKWTCTMKPDGCYDRVSIDCSASETCNNGVCQPLLPQKVVFRTDVFGGNYYSCTSTSNCWIALDNDNDGDLDAMGFGTKLSTCAPGSFVVKTPEGFNVYRYGSNKYVGICDGSNRKIVFDKTKVPINPELSTNPTEPYKSNNQETYE